MGLTKYYKSGYGPDERAALAKKIKWKFYKRLRPQGGGGVGGSKTMLDYFLNLIEQSEMQKTASKDIIPSESYEALCANFNSDF